MTIDDKDLTLEEGTADESVVEEETIENSEVPEESGTEPENIQDGNEDDEEDRVITIGDSAPEEEEEHREAPGWVRNVRKKNRKLESELKKLKRQIEENEKAAQVEKPVELGPKPTLKSCGYDEEEWSKQTMAYVERKRKIEEQEAQKTKTLEDQNKAWQERQRKYVDLKEEHGFKDFPDAEDLVSNTLSQTQQGIIVQGADDAALVVYALGKYPKKLEEMSKITDPVEFAMKIGKLESQLNVSNRKAPPPEKKVATGKSGGISGNSDKVLEQLREEAGRTGDYTKVSAYKRKLRNKG